MKYLITLPILVLLAACGGRATTPAPEPIKVPVEVYVPIAGACVPNTLGPPPEYVDTDAALHKAKDAAERYQLLWAGRSQMKGRLNEIEPIIAGCPRGEVKK